MAKKQITMGRNTNKILKEGFKEFLIYSRAKNLSSNTLTYYEDCFYKFCTFVDEDILIREIDRETVQDFILFLRDSDISSVTLNTQLRGIRVFLYYFMELEYMDKFSISKVKQDKPIKDTYSEGEIKILLVKPNIKKCQFTEYRDWIIVNILLGTGMRIRTLINLQIKDIDLDSQLITYKVTKNRNQQLVPLSITLVKILREYIEIRMKNTDMNDWLFCSRYGEKLTNNALQHSLKKYNNRRGVIKQGCHMWRHTFAKMWILKNGNILKLQKILGHSSLDMVKEYVEIFTSDLQSDFNTYNPLEQMQESRNFLKLNNK